MQQKGRIRVSENPYFCMFYAVFLGLYRDDGLGIFKNMPGPEIEWKSKYIINAFKNCGLKVIIKANLASVDFLGVRWNLKTKSNPIYINKHSNQTPNIIKDILKSVSKRLSDISCNQNIFEKAVPEFKTTLKKSDFRDNLYHVQQSDPKSENSSSKRKRKRNSIWFNLPYSAKFITGVEKDFFNF